MRALWTMTVSDLRQRIRDRSVFIFALAVPLALMFVFNLTFGGAEDVELGTVEAAVSVPEDDPLAETLVTAVVDSGAVEVRRTDLAADDVRAAVRDGRAALGVVVPDGFAESVRSGREAVVEVVRGEHDELETGVLIAVLDGVLDRMAAGTGAAQAGESLGLSRGEIAAVAEEVATSSVPIDLEPGEASSEQLGSAATLVAGQAGLFLLFTVGFGVLGLLEEREQGTLARLRSMPMHPGLIVAAKGMVSYVLGVAATAVLLTVGGLLFGVSFGSPTAVAVLVLCVVAAAVSLMFVIARVARTAEQASVTQSILALLLGMSAGAFFPITAGGALGRVLDLNPVAAFLRGLGITQSGGGIGDLGTPVLVMLGFAVVTATVSRLIPDRGAEA